MFRSSWTDETLCRTGQDASRTPPGLHPCNLSQKVPISQNGRPEPPASTGGKRGGGGVEGGKGDGGKGKIYFCARLQRCRPLGDRGTSWSLLHDVSSPQDKRNTVFYNVWLTCMLYLLQFIKKTDFGQSLDDLQFFYFCIFLISFQ